VYEFLNFNQLKIILAGYGRMGHELEKLAHQRGHEIVAIFDKEADWDSKEIPDCDVAIDFTFPEIAPVIVNRLLDHDIPVVSGTTGWNDKQEQVKQRVMNEGKAYFTASNFSLGVNIFFEINKKLASLLCPFPEYKSSVHEIHHVHKKDAPSGTAITLAEAISDSCSRYEGWNYESETVNIIKVTSERTGEVPGTHIISWNSPVDEIQIKHTAHSRQGFALGAMIAAEWLIDKKGVYGMKDLLNLDI
jgi:4-hydroxy-tetrahydrodipicolinate reductase